MAPPNLLTLKKNCTPEGRSSQTPKRGSPSLTGCGHNPPALFHPSMAHHGHILAIQKDTYRRIKMTTASGMQHEEPHPSSTTTTRFTSLLTLLSTKRPKLEYPHSKSPQCRAYVAYAMARSRQVQRVNPLDLLVSPLEPHTTPSV